MNTPMMDAQAYDNLASELRRGLAVMAVLSLCRDLQYGYSLKQRLSEAGLEVSEGTLYPLLRRLEAQGLLESRWEVVDDQRPRRYYLLSPLGTTTLPQLIDEWKSLVAALARLGIEKEQTR
ncbi:PadR family transcriptional regulator [Caldilinea sp.]|uniref:PadR family transcriptional regulator n=1 Tax=Caldilinea sp. TaxID=2293560 RepID=UPI002BE6BB6D|nr:PadR family transcriptional regulator [Caldilinea sp.]